MPTNLPPECVAIEKRYRAAESTEDKIALLEELLGAIPKHKGTDHLRADYRRRLSKLKASVQARKKTGRRDTTYQIEPEGAGQAIIVGCTNVGKSSLVAALTNATPEVSDSPFTTWAPTPGMMPVEDIQIQLVDTPPLNPDYVEPQLMNLIRRADLLLLVVDLQAHPLQQLEDAIAILEEHRIVPAHRQGLLADPDRLAFKPLIVLVNKNDDEGTEEDFQIFLELLEEDWPLVSVSTVSGRNLEYLKQVVFEHLDIVRVYSKAPGRDPDYSAPFVLPKGATVGDLAGKVHRDFYDFLKAARVWGRGVYDGQLVSRDHVLHDGDVVELRI
jgi:uncharacterized protein